MSELTKDWNIKMTVMQGRILKNVVDSFPGKSTLLKDMRKEKVLVDKIKEALPEIPEKPKPPEPANGESFTPEEIKKNNELVKEFEKRIEDEGKNEIEIVFSSVDRGIIRKRLENHSGFNVDGKMRDVIVDLADKFGNA